MNSSNDQLFSSNCLKIAFFVGPYNIVMDCFTWRKPEVNSAQAIENLMLLLQGSQDAGNCTPVCNVSPEGVALQSSSRLSYSGKDAKHGLAEKQ